MFVPGMRNAESSKVASASIRASLPMSSSPPSTRIIDVRSSVGRPKLMMIVVGASYRQTIRAYPNGGGSYTVTGDNFGPLAGLTAGAGLMIDYVMTVAVSIALP